MVSFWPFRGDDKSAAGFEKILSSLSQKISKIGAKDARLRSQQRRFKALWTLYTALAYLIAVLILVLVVGWKAWGAAEISGLAGGPPLIYAVRLAIDTFYTYRLSGTQAQLDDLQKQRSEAIAKLKAATKYDSTQQLLDKYGGTASKAPKTPPEKQKLSSAGRSQQEGPGQRTGIAPPPTANIPNRSPMVASPARDGLAAPQQQPVSPSSDPSAEFAPNAFSPSDPFQGPFSQYTNSPIAGQSSSAQLAPAAPASSSLGDGGRLHWTDRILDLIMGEDETQPRNRIALICSRAECRQVNGLAPPGTRSLEDVGKWRCVRCGSWNGIESVAAKAIRDVTGDAVPVPESPSPARRTTGVTDEASLRSAEEPEKYDDDESEENQGLNIGDKDGESAPAKSSGRSTRTGARQRSKKG